MSASGTSSNKPCPTLTVLRTVGAHRATKQFRWNATSQEWLKLSYSAGSRFTPRECPIASLADLAAVIEAVRRDPRTFVVRGALAPWAQAEIAAEAEFTIRRHKLPRADGRPASLQEVPQHWIVIDIDRFPLLDTDDLADDPEIAIDRAIHALLPAAFHDATCWWQLSSSAGFAPGVLKAHLFYWLPEPAFDTTIRAVLAQHAPTIDRAPLNAAQPLYIADPIIIGGHDPLPRRTGWLHRFDDTVTLPEVAESHRRHVPPTGEPHFSDAPLAPVEQIADALAYIPNSELQWDDWNRIGMAAWRASGGTEAGFVAWCAWSAKSEKHDPDACRERWDHFAISPPGFIGAGTIFYLAAEGGWQPERSRKGELLDPPPHRAAAPVMRAACDILAAGRPADDLPGVVQARIRHLHSPHRDAALAGEETPDLSRLAALAAAEGLSLDDAYNLTLRDVDDAIHDAERRLARPTPDDDRRHLKREIERLDAVRKHREIEWSDTLAQADFALDAITTDTAAAPAESIKRPTVTYDEAVAAVEQIIGEAFNGTGPRQQLIIASCGTRKTHHAVTTAARHAAQRRQERREWLNQYHRHHPGTSRTDALDALNREGPRLYRVLYLGERHKQVRDAVNLARQHGMLAEHHGGYDRGFDPADDDAPAVCTQPARRKATEQAGEPVPEVACGRAKDATPCPDLGGCRRWQRLANSAHAEFNGTTIDYATGRMLPRELLDNDLIIIDEVADRALFPESSVPLDCLSDRHFMAHPVRNDTGEPDDALTDLARSEYRLFRDTVDAAPDGYSRAALRAVGLDDARLLRLVELTDVRNTPSGMTSATPDQRRTELAQASFCKQIAALCGMFRQLAEPGDGWVRIEGDGEKRRAIVRRIAALHPSIMEGRILALDGSGDLSLSSWRALIPDIEAIAVPIPHAPYETSVQIVRPNGKHAMRRPERLAYDQAIQRLYSHGLTGVLTHQEHEEAFMALGTLTGHFMATAGSNEWLQCSTMLTFGLPFLSPEAAAHEAAGRTGEPVEPTMPVRTLRPVAMRAGGVSLVPSMEYQHPAAHDAQGGVRDRQAMQGPGGRSRGSMRDADNPVLSIYVGTSPIPGQVQDYVLSDPEQFASDRFVRMVATGLAVASGPDRHRLHPDIYPKLRTAEYDLPREAGGFLATLQRVLYPAWWGDRPRTIWVELRYWVKGRGNRSEGRSAACLIGQIAWAKRQLREACNAVRIELVAEVHRPSAEVPMMPVESNYTWILGTCPRPQTGSLFGHLAEAGDRPSDAERPPDG